MGGKLRGFEVQLAEDEVVGFLKDLGDVLKKSGRGNADAISKVFRAVHVRGRFPGFLRAANAGVRGVRFELKAAAHFARKYGDGAQVLLRRSILKWGTKGSGDMDILLRLLGANELILIEAKLTAAAAAKSGALRKFMQKIAEHPTVVIEEGAAALPIKKFILQFGETLPTSIKAKLQTELRDDKIWSESLIPTADRLIKDTLE